MVCFAIWIVMWCAVIADLFQQNPHFHSGLWAPLMGAFAIVEWLLGRQLDTNTLSELVIPFFAFWVASIAIVGISGGIGLCWGTDEKQEKEAKSP